MKSQILHVVAVITAQAGKEKELSVALQALVEPTRKEDGCIRYELMQNKQSPEQFIFVEEWKDDEALDKHLMSPHVSEALRSAASLLAKAPEINRCKPVG